MEIPRAYEGREHTFLKHRVLERYLKAWAHKLGSIASQRPVCLWYVDCFAGPWRAKDADLADTSISIGLEALRSAAETLGHLTPALNLGAVFVEKNGRSFASLRQFVEARGGPIQVHPLQGAFGDCVEEIEKLIGNEPAFLFVDPTGWKGVGMKLIARLAKRPRRDVMVNVMFEDINRFKDDPRAFLRAQMREFFGLDDADIPTGLSEEDLIAFYRQQLKSVCGLPFVLDLAIPHPEKNRTKYRLVVGGHHEQVVSLFREVERQVVGREAPGIRAAARERQQIKRTGQASLPLPGVRVEEKSSRIPHPTSAELERHLKDLVGTGSATYNMLWPQLLELCHMTEPELRKLLWLMAEAGVLDVQNRSGDERTLKARHRIALRA